MSVKRPRAGSGGEPAYIRQQREWGRDVARELDMYRPVGGTQTPGGSAPFPEPRDIAANAFAAAFTHREIYSNLYALRVQAGKISNAFGTVTVATADIALPGSGDLYVYATATLTSSTAAPSAASITSNASRPAYWSSPVVVNVVLGILVEVTSGVWEWVEEHRGNILLDEASETSSAKNITYVGEHQQLVRSSVTWARYSQGATRGLSMTVLTGIAFYSPADEKLYAYAQNLEFDQFGHLISVSEETRVEIMNPADICCDSSSSSTTTTTPTTTTTTT